MRFAVLCQLRETQLRDVGRQSWICGFEDSVLLREERASEKYKVHVSGRRVGHGPADPGEKREERAFDLPMLRDQALGIDRVAEVSADQQFLHRGDGSGDIAIDL